MIDSTRRKFLTSLVVPFTVAACQPASAPDKTAAQFIDRYYVNMSLSEAKQLSTGLAAEKLDSQIKLLDGQKVTPGTNVPKVLVHQVSSEKVSDQEMAFIFEVKPEAEDVGRRKVYVKVRKEGDRWLVSQFTEADQGQ